MRRIREREERIPAPFRMATDALIADRLGIRVREGYHWEWGSADAGYTEVLQRLHDRNKPIQAEKCTPHQHKTPDMTRRSVQFWKMRRGSWYIIHNPLHNWSAGGRRGDTSTNNELRNTFIAGFVALMPKCTPRPLTHVHEGRGAKDQELREYSLFAQYVARIEKMSRETQEGHTEYSPLVRLDFDKLSRRCQVLELQRTGMLVDNGEEAKKFYIKTDEKTYPPPI